MAVITGTSGDDILIQNAGEDDQLDGLEGLDTLDLSGMGEPARLYLNVTAAQMIGPGQGSDTLANIENAIGTSFDDLIVGGLLGSVINGGSGNDTLLARGGDDDLNGGPGNDFLSGSSGNDRLNGLNGNDVLRGGLGTNVLDGSSGLDRADYSTGTEAVFASLLSRTALDKDGSGDFRDTLISIEELNGSAHNDTLVGNDLNNKLFGLEGNDFLDGRDGIDILAGGSGDDVLLGGDGRGQYYGGTGNDYFRPGIGRDKIVGEDGTDTIDYSRQTDGLFINLQSGRAFELDGSLLTNHRIYTIENAVGTDAKDTMVGNDGANLLQANDGDDHIDGKGGDDILDGRAGNDTILGGDGDDQLTGGDGDDFLRPGLGNDIVKGGAGVDRLDGTGREKGVSLDMRNPGNQGNGLFVEGIEEVIGTHLGDHIHGDAGTNRFWGNDGNDHFYTHGGMDEFYGGAGDDYVFLDSNEFAVLDGGTGYDRITIDYEGTLNLTDFVASGVSSFEFFDLGYSPETHFIPTYQGVHELGGRIDIQGEIADIIDMSQDSWTYIGTDFIDHIGGVFVFQDGDAFVYASNNAQIIFPFPEAPDLSVSWETANNALGQGTVFINATSDDPLNYEFRPNNNVVGTDQVTPIGGQAQFDINIEIDPTLTRWDTAHDGFISVTDSFGIEQRIDLNIEAVPDTQLVLDGQVTDLSSDGRYAAAIYDDQVRLYDVTDGSFEVISKASDGTQGNGVSSKASMSADGRLIAFASTSSNLDPLDTDTSANVFVHDRDTGITKLISFDDMGGKLNGAPSTLTMLNDGSKVGLGYGSASYYYDIAASQSQLLIEEGGAQFARDTNAIAFIENNFPYSYYFWKDLISGQVELIATFDYNNYPGVQGGGIQDISADGTKVYYNTYSDGYSYASGGTVSYDVNSGRTVGIDSWDDGSIYRYATRFESTPMREGSFLAIRPTTYEYDHRDDEYVAFVFGSKTFAVDADNSVLARNNRDGTFTVSGDTARDLYVGENGHTNILYAQQYGGTLVGQDRGDLLIGAYFSDDILNGKAGDDTLIGRGGADTLIGGDGDDLLVPFGANSRALGGEGFDTVDLSSAHSYVNIDLSIKGFQTISEPYGAIQFLDIEKIIGGNNNNLVRGTRNAETLIGGDGDDRLGGGGGADTLIGFGGIDRFTPFDLNFAQFDGGAGEDVLNLHGDWKRWNLSDLNDGQIKDVEVIDISFGGRDSRTWTSLSADDVRKFGDTLIVANTAPWDDYLNLSADDWTYIETITDPVWDDLEHYQSGGVDLYVSEYLRVQIDSFIKGFHWNESSSPTLNIDYTSKSGQAYNYTFDDQNFVTQPTNGLGTISLNLPSDFAINGGNIEFEFFHGGGSRENYWFDATGWDEAFNVLRAAGNDTILTGGGLPDHIQGDRGDDIITGAGSNDMLIGGEGDDLFIIAYGDGADTILDFMAGVGTEDAIDVSDFGFASLADFTITQQGGDTLVDFGTASALLKGVIASDLHADDFILT